MKKRKRLALPILFGILCMSLLPIRIYATVESGGSTQLTSTVPEKPEPQMQVSEEVETLADISLPEGWHWKDESIEIQPGRVTIATAVYENGHEMEVRVTGMLKILLDGTDTEYTIGSENTASIHCNGVLDALLGVEMDGDEINTNNYDTAEGSTIITFKKVYLDTLSVGKHTVTLNYEAGSVDTILEIKSVSVTPTPTITPSPTRTPTTTSTPTVEQKPTGTTTNTTSAKTGDDTNVVFLVMMLMLSLGMIFVTIRKTSH